MAATAAAEAAAESRDDAPPRGVGVGDEGLQKEPGPAPTRRRLRGDGAIPAKRSTVLFATAQAGRARLGQEMLAQERLAGSPASCRGTCAGESVPSAVKQLPPPRQHARCATVPSGGRGMQGKGQTPSVETPGVQSETPGQKEENRPNWERAARTRKGCGGVWCGPTLSRCGGGSCPNSGVARATQVERTKTRRRGPDLRRVGVDG